MDRLTYQRIGDAEDFEDAIVVRIWKQDGQLFGEVDYSVLHHAETGRIIVPVPADVVLNNAQQMRDEMLFDTIYVQIDDGSDWQEKWGTLLPIRPSALITKPFKL